MAYVSDTTAVLAYLIVLIAAIHQLAEQRFLAVFFRFFPPAIWVYFLPMLSSNLGIIPQSHALYDWIRTYLLPTALILMLFSANVPALARLGGKAVLTMFIGSAGIALGAILSFGLLHPLLPQGAWKGIGPLVGSWVGGGANMVAVSTSIGTPDSMLGPIIVVDTVVGYGWMGVVIALSVLQDRLDASNKVDRTIIDQLNKRMATLDAANRRPIKFLDLLTIVGIGFGLGHAMVQFGRYMPELGAVLNAFGWAVILATAAGIALSFTSISNLEYAGAGIIGNFFFYLLLTTIGARADVAGILDAPTFLFLGVIIIAFHAAGLFLAGRYLKSPMFLMATASQANIGGPVTAPIVATVYQSSLAPVGLLMAVLGNIIGTFVGLGVAQVCYWISP
ncbi:MAG TPA: DUF819 family protein [Bacteroidota bacterium]|nr:DUF819 family protein [Bacteroidota bacterium]